MRITATLLLTLLSVCLNAQTVNQLIVVNGGVFFDLTDNVTVATVNPDLTGYTVFDEIKTEAAQDITVRGNIAWVAALDSLVVYDIDTYTRIATAYVPGVNKVEPFGDFILVGRGFGASSDFLQVRNAMDLSLVSNIPVTAETGGMVTTPTTAYVAIPGDFYATTGRLAVVDMVNMNLVQEIDLGTDGAGIDALFLESDRVLAVCGGAGNLLAINPTSGTYTAASLGSIASYAGAARNGDKLYFQYGGFFDADLGVFDLGSKTTENAALIAGAYAEVQIDPLSGNIYRTTTDFFSTGELFLHDASGAVINSIPVGISPEHVAVDVRGNCTAPEGMSTTVTTNSATISWEVVSPAISYSVTGRESGTAGLRTVTTPVNSITIDDLTPGTSYEFAIRTQCSTEASAFSAVRTFTTSTMRSAMPLRYELADLQGRVVARGQFFNKFELNNLPAGLYLLSEVSEQGTVTQKIYID